MIKELISGVIVSLIASAISGYLTDKAFGKEKSFLAKIYIVFIGFSVFFSVIELTFLLKSDIIIRALNFNDTNVFLVFKLCLLLLGAQFISVLLFTIIVIVTNSINLYDKGINKSLSDILKSSKSINIENESLNTELTNNGKV